MIKLNKPVSNFTFTATDGEQTIDTDLKSVLKQHNLVIYFYPKDNTPGCTTEAIDFTAAKAKFAKANTVVYGVSRDSLKKHENFIAKQQLAISLISDPDETLCKLFDVMKEKMLYGKKFIGIERSTFLIDQQGVLRHEWRKVKVKEHVAEVLTAAKALV